MLRLDLDVARLTLRAAEGLVDHHLAVGQGVAHTLLARAEEEGSHAGGAAHAHGGDGRGDVVHGIVDGHARRDGAAGAVDVEINLFFRVLRFEEKQLGADEGRHRVVDLGAEEHDAVFQQAGKNIISAFGAARRFDDDGHRHIKNILHTVSI